MSGLLDLLPLLAFFYFSKQQGVLAGAAALLITTLVVYVVHFSRQKGKLNKQQGDADFDGGILWIKLNFP